MNISQNALIKRINRKLPDDEVLRTLRGERWVSELGRFYVVNWYTNTIVATHCNLEVLARELDVLAYEGSLL